MTKTGQGSEDMQAELDELLGRIGDLLRRAGEQGLALRFGRMPVPAAAAAGPAPTVVQARPEPESVRQRPPPKEWRAPLRALLATLRFDRLAAEEAEDLGALLRDDERLLAFPQDVQHLLLQYGAARLRYLQRRNFDDAVIVPLLSAVAAFAQRERCGFVNGPRRTSAPRTNSWEHDANGYVNELYDRALMGEDGEVSPGRVIGIIESAIRDAAPFEEVRPLIASALRIGVGAANTRLVNLTAPFLTEMQAAPELKSLRNAIRTAARDALPPPEPESPAIPPDWPWFAVTCGKRAVMIGGDPREPNRDRIERAFGFGSLEWEKTEHSPRSIQSVRDRVASGRVDLLIILRRFVGHDTDEQLIPACAQTGTPWVSVPSGYGIERIRQEIEHRVPRPEPT